MESEDRDMTAPPLAQVFVYPARVKFLAVLADDPDEEFSATTLANHADTDPSTWTDHREALLELGFVEERETSGRYPRYALADTPHARLLRELSSELDAVLLDANDPLEDAIGGFIR